jgi:cytidyltransferase-like protein
MVKKKTVTVAVSGAFDPIHIGHIRYLRAAAKLGDKLIVILNKDEFLMKKKGFVFWPFEARKEIIEGIKGVDEVIEAVDDDLTVRKTLEKIKPDIFAKGGADLESIPEVDVCRGIGCKLELNVGGSRIFSDAELSQKVKNSEPARAGKPKIACPYCNNHPMLRVKCLYCGGTGKIEVGKPR